MERFVVLPFGCVSESSVDVALPHPRRSKPATRTREDEEDEEILSGEISMKPDISTGVHKLFKTFKTLSQLFVYKEGMEDSESEEEMEIGSPTDVKHVAHVGLNETTSSSPSKSMESLDNLFYPQHLFTMETQAAAPSVPIVQAST